MKFWYDSHCTWQAILLWPLAGLFRVTTALRYFLYRCHLKKTIHFPVPVIVVGNIAIGGTGKTPFVIWLAEQLKKAGYHPGIVSRGAGGQTSKQPRKVTADSDPALVGDEAVLLARRTQCPLIISPNRVAAVELLLQTTQCDVVISDDGLQHYRMGRAIEIVMVDGVRQFGNQCLLPAGPLREPLSRLQRAQLVVVKGQHMQLSGQTVVSVVDPTQTLPLDFFQHQTVHVLAGIGHPQQFFTELRAAGLQVIEHVFPDHFRYQRQDIYFPDALPVLMTEKDAVKCRPFANRHHWYLPVDARVDEAVAETIFNLLRNRS